MIIISVSIIQQFKIRIKHIARRLESVGGRRVGAYESIASGKRTREGWTTSSDSTVSTRTRSQVARRAGEGRRRRV